jgi:ADP-heptose:LPS heptosyltransferase
MMRLPAAEIKTIVIFRALQLGDLLCSVPAWRSLRIAYPLAEISFIGLPGMKELIERYPQYIDDFIAFPGYPGLPEQPFDEQQFNFFLSKMKARHFDLAIQLQGNGTIVNQLLNQFGARYLAGFCQSPAMETPLLLSYPNFGQEITRHLALMKHLGLPDSDNTALEFNVLEEDETALQQLQLDLKKKQYVCIHPGSRGSWRQWPTLYFATVADFCTARGYKVVITGTEHEMQLAQSVAKLCKHQPLICSGRTNLGTIAALLKDAKALIANCTGVSHLAAAIKTPSVIISMDGEPERWAPLHKEIHRTIDWTTNPDDQQVLIEVDSLLTN